MLCEVFAVTYTNLISKMRETMVSLSKTGTAKMLADELDGAESSQSSQQNSRTSQRFLPDRVVDLKATARGTEYTILGLLEDYKSVMLGAKEFNSLVGRVMAGTNISNYGQFISDVFIMIQLLKEPETDIFAVMFFFYDACSGMVMMFRMLILMSRLYPASEEFLEAFKTYLQHETPIRRYLLKYKKNLRIVAAKIGGYSTSPITVPKGVHVLFNYYIGAAMWQRPLDRRT